MKDNNGYETLEDLKEICEHIDELSGYCYEFKEACFYEDQTLCSEYSPKWRDKEKNKK